MDIIQVGKSKKVMKTPTNQETPEPTQAQMSCKEKCICGTRGREWETKNWCLLQKTVNQPVKMPTEKQVWQMELADEMRGRMRDWPQFMREAVMEVYYNSTKQGA